MEQTALPQSNQKTVLVVDDDAAVLAFVSSVLESTYKVLTATGGADALQKSKDYPGEIDLIFIRLPNASNEWHRFGYDDDA